MSEAAAYRYPRYKRITSAMVLLVAALWAAYVLLWPNQTKASGVGIANGTPAPDFELKTIDGTTHRLSDYKGKVVMINFFATWCPPCRAEMPALQAAYEEYESKGFVILAVNLGESDVAIRAFQEDYQLTFPILVDKDDAVTRMYDIVPLPTSYFVDKDGIVRQKVTGEIRPPQLRQIIEQLL